MSIREKHNSALTLIEVMVAMVVIIVAVMGAMGFRYYSAMDARKADVQITAGRLGLLLLEGWKATGGGVAYDPVSEFGTELIISDNATGPGAAAGFSTLNSYAIAANGVNYYTTLSYKDATLAEPRILNVSTAWLPGYGTGTVSSNTPSVKLTTYVNN